MEKKKEDEEEEKKKVVEKCCTKSSDVLMVGENEAVDVEDDGPVGEEEEESRVECKRTKNVVRKKNLKEKHVPDVVYRKTVQQNDTTSQNEISVKSNRKRNQRINEPPPWNDTSSVEASAWIHNATSNTDDVTKHKSSEEDEDDDHLSLTPSSTSSSNTSLPSPLEEEDENKENVQNYTNTSSSPSSPGSTDSSSSSSKSTPQSTLTRRQKKNRVRRNLELNARIPINRLSRFYERLSMKDSELHKYLSHYVLTQQQLVNFSFPFESKFCSSKAVIYSPGRYNPKVLDPKAREFVPSHYNLTHNKLLLKTQHEQILWRPDVLPEENLEDAQEKICARCSKSFYLISSNATNITAPTLQGRAAAVALGYQYLTQENCHYHWGKVTKSWVEGVQNAIYSCCNEQQYKTAGCVYAKLHVWSGLKPGVNGPLDGYVKTKPRKSPPPNGYGVYALDTEMVYTVHGLEVARVTVVNIDGRLIYNTLVKPECEIIDYNTKYSGISAKDFIKNPFKSLKDVQNDLMGFISKDSIIVGHGLENDLRALKLIHGHIIDTSILFPHSFGLPYRRSLKAIVNQLLHQSIQSGTHDSFEDARACIDLILWKLFNDFRFKNN